MFGINGSRYSEPNPEWDNVEDEAKIRLCDVAPRVNQKFVYEYDMGDGWEHETVIEAIVEADPRFKGVPVCLEGERACPPEDCGGMGRFEELLKAIQNPNHKEHKEMLEWIGGEYDAAAFNLNAINQILKRFK